MRLAPHQAHRARRLHEGARLEALCLRELGWPPPLPVRGRTGRASPPRTVRPVRMSNGRPAARSRGRALAGDVAQSRRAVGRGGVDDLGDVFGFLVPAGGSRLPRCGGHVDRRLVSVSSGLVVNTNDRPPKSVFTPPGQGAQLAAEGRARPSCPCGVVPRLRSRGRRAVAARTRPMSWLRAFRAPCERCSFARW